MIDAVGRKFFKLFKKGDLVSWKKLNPTKKQYGFIEKIYLKELDSGRSFVMASIIDTNGNKGEFYVGELNLEAKSFHKQ